MVTYFEDHGWAASDITAYINTSKANPGCLVCQPEDFYNMSNYGIVLFFGHCGRYAVSYTYNLYIDIGYVTWSEILSDKQWDNWWKHEQMVILGGFTGTDGVKIAEVMLRADVIDQKLSKLPSSYVNFASCDGDGFADIFINHGATVFNSWSGPVKAAPADNNVKAMVDNMIGKNDSAYNAFSDDSTLKEATGTSQFGQVIPCLFDLYPSTDVASYYYLPAWVEQVKVNNVPENASTVKVSLFNSHSVLLKSNTVPGTSTAISVSGFDKFLFPATDKITIQVDALDKDNKVIQTQKNPVITNAGSNSVVINMGGYTWDLSGGEEGINFEAGSLIEMSQFSELDIYVNGVLVNTVKVSNADPGLYPAPINIQANTGDTLRLVFHCDWNQPFSHYTQWLGELWITRADEFSDVVQLTKEQDFGSNDDGLPKKEITFDETFILPKFPLTSTTLLPGNTSTITP